MSARPSTCLFRDPSREDLLVESGYVLKSEAGAKRARVRVEVGMKEELQEQVASPQNHPAAIAPSLDETKAAVKVRGCLEVARGEIGCGDILHLHGPLRHGEANVRNGS